MQAQGQWTRATTSSSTDAMGITDLRSTNIDDLYASNGTSYRGRGTGSDESINPAQYEVMVKGWVGRCFSENLDLLIRQSITSKINLMQTFLSLEPADYWSRYPLRC